jgi:hypothetical protein
MKILGLYNSNNEIISKGNNFKYIDNTWICDEGYRIVDFDKELTLRPIYENPTREEKKEQRAELVSAIKVITQSGKQFDGDETAQTRMARAIIGMQAANVSTINWTLATNISTPVTLAELTEALILSGQEQAALWPIED